MKLETRQNKALQNKRTPQRSPVGAKKGLFGKTKRERGKVLKASGNSS